VAWLDIVSHTEPGAALIVNGQSVPNIAPDGNFRHFTEQLAPGQHTISIIGSNRRGGTAMKQVPSWFRNKSSEVKTQAPLRWSWCPETIGAGAGHGEASTIAGRTAEGLSPQGDVGMNKNGYKHEVGVQSVFFRPRHRSGHCEHTGVRTRQRHCRQ